jgi:hypothetical protein
MCLLGVSMKIIALLTAKICSLKEKNQYEKYEYKAIFPYKNTVCFSLPHGKTLRKWSRKLLRKWSRKRLRKWLRVFTKGFTAENF